MWGPKQEKVRKPGVMRLYCWIFGCQKKSVVYETECSHASDFILNYVLKWEFSAVFPGDVLSGGDGMSRGQVLQQSSEFSGEVCGCLVVRAPDS